MEQWQCCFVPSDNTRGVEASIGEAPNWYSFVPYLRLGGLSDEEIENIKLINNIIKAQHQNWFLTLNSSIKNRSLHSNKILFS